MNRISNALVALVLAVAALGGACGHDIGDSCKTSVDCDPNGTRSCDLSQPGGYCTVAGCDATTAPCPDGSTCIRTFPEALLAATATAAGMPMTCDPRTAGGCGSGMACASAGFCAKACDPAGAAPQCPGKEVCPSFGYCAQCDPAREDIPTEDTSTGTVVTQNNCLADEICLDSGLCAKQSYEQRQCAKSCSSNSDCRGGYECRKTGLLGSMVLAKNPLATTAFCAPHI